MSVGGKGVSVGGIGVSVGGTGVLVGGAGVGVGLGALVATGAGVAGVGTCAVGVVKTLYAIAVSVALRSGVGCGAQDASTKTLSSNPSFFICCVFCGNSSLWGVVIMSLSWEAVPKSIVQGGHRQ